MASIYDHPFPVHVQLVRGWRMDTLSLDVWTETPNDMKSSLPVVKIGAAPSGYITGPGRGVSIDIDLFTTSQGDMDVLAQRVDNAMCRLAGNGNSYGYADEVTGGSSPAVDYGNPDRRGSDTPYCPVVSPLRHKHTKPKE